MPNASVTVTDILEAAGEKMANGYGFVRSFVTGNYERHGVDVFDSTIIVNGRKFWVRVAWPDGAEIHELDPIIFEVE